MSFKKGDRVVARFTHFGTAGVFHGVVTRRLYAGIIRVKLYDPARKTDFFQNFTDTARALSYEPIVDLLAELA